MAFSVRLLDIGTWPLDRNAVSGCFWFRLQRTASSGFLVVFTAGGLQVELLDGEQEHQVEHHESGDAHGDQQPGLIGSGQEGREDGVGQAGGEAEASAVAQSDGDGSEDGVQQSVHNVQGECQEHEGELEGLGNAAQEGTDSGGANDTDGSLPLVGLGGLDHGQSSAGDTEHHAGEEGELNIELANDDYTTMAQIILEGLGGKDNIVSIDHCITRLRLEVKDRLQVDEKKIKISGAAGVIRPGKTSVQVIIGPKVQFVYDEFKKIAK